MKILDLAEFYSERGGGVRAYLSQLIREGTLLGHNISVIAPGPRDERCPHEGGVVIRIRGPSLPYDPSYHLLWNLNAVARAVKTQSPDVLEVSSPYAAALMATRIKGVSVKSLAVHSDFIDTYARPVLSARISQKSTDMVLWPAWAWLRSLTRRMDVTVVSGRWLADKLKAHGCERVECVPFGIERESFGAERRDEALRRELLGDAAGREGASLVAVAGRLAIEKNVDLVLDAMIDLSRRRAISVVILGDGPERARLEARARDLPVKWFLGFVTDRAYYARVLASSDVLVHGCPHETFGFVVAEALASGVAVVVPDRGGAAEFAREGASMTYSIGASARRAALDCAVATDRLLESPREKLRARAIEASEGISSAREHFQKLFGLYEELLSRRVH